ncbi:hypothetical protein MAR_013629 [Mya arenaria]|uniref:Uncharacterized protein n=1 Tax=Mya arenaria TaxID=6604 RepID=A0ABY7G0E5_MYAAR|nr:hypothetical protein MAR_013629 [Mya arenaria]
MGACQCGRTHRNQCVACDHLDQCGNKPWTADGLGPFNIFQTQSVGVVNVTV